MYVVIVRTNVRNFLVYFFLLLRRPLLLSSLYKFFHFQSKEGRKKEEKKTYAIHRANEENKLRVKVRTLQVATWKFCAARHGEKSVK